MSSVPLNGCVTYAGMRWDRAPGDRAFEPALESAWVLYGPEIVRERAQRGGHPSYCGLLLSLEAPEPLRDGTVLPDGLGHDEIV